jgi:dienelactone hydrolase
MRPTPMQNNKNTDNGENIIIPVNKIHLEGNLHIPKDAKGIVLFAHGSGSSRFSSRNRYVAKVLQKAGIATLLFDLLSPPEEKIDSVTRELRFNIDLLTQRLLVATDWIKHNKKTQGLAIGYFGASTGAAAALVAAAKLTEDIRAVVSRGGRVDLAEQALKLVKAPTLFIVGEDDDVVITLNREALKMLVSRSELAIVPGASHLFEEPGALEEVAVLARDWFKEYL